MTLSLRPFSSLARAVLFKTNTVALPTGYLFGLTLSQASTTSVGIAAGSCRDSTDADNMVLGAFTKTTGAWAVGTGNGGLDTGSIAASTWYHVFPIKTVPGLGGSTDALISLSASSPTMPTGYALNRRIGSVLTDGSKHIIAFVQLGDEFLWSTPVADVASTNPGTSAVLRTLTVPTGIQVWAKYRYLAFQGDANANTYLLTSPDEGDRVPNATAGDLDGPAIEATALLSEEAGNQMITRTNTSAQIRSRFSFSNANTVLDIATYGWIDTRGRLY